MSYFAVPSLGGNSGTVSVGAGIPPGDIALTDTYGVTDDAPALNSAITTLSQNGGGCIYVPTGTHRLKSTVNITSNGIRITGEARDRVKFLIDDSSGNIGDGFQIKDTYGVELRDFTINAQAQRTAGNGIRVMGGDPTKTVVGLPLHNSGTLITNVDMSGQFTGIAIENDPVGPYENWRTYIKGGYHGNISTGGHGIWINDRSGASHFSENWYFGQSVALTPTAGIRLTGTGDVTLTNNEVFGSSYPLLVDPPAAGIAVCINVLGGFYDTAGSACLRIAPNAAASCCVIKAIGTWFGTSAGNAAELVGAALKGAHFTNCTFTNATAGWACIVDAATDVEFQGCGFSSSTGGGVKFTNSAQRFMAQGCKFLLKEHYGAISGLPVGVQIDAGCDHYAVTGNVFDTGIATKITNTPGDSAGRRDATTGNITA